MEHYKGKGRHPDLVKSRQDKLAKANDVAPSINKLLKRVKELEARVAKLEA